MKLGNYEVHFTTDYYKKTKGLCACYRDCYIIDEEYGKVYLTIGYNYVLKYNEDSEVVYTRDYAPIYLFIDNQITENEYHVYAETIEL